MIDIYEDMPEKLTDSLIELLIARRGDAYYGILSKDKKYVKSKNLIENHIWNLRKKDPKSANILESAISYVEEKITVNLYNKGFKDGQELCQLKVATIEIND